MQSSRFMIDSSRGLYSIKEAEEFDIQAGHGDHVTAAIRFFKMKGCNVCGGW